ncbi:hypothetical protein [Nodosilinea nodulosa]|uniref:hypothetical protein n=1 Tax=Nodosilinea nodulosa TaxID=416001 RepID=UPI0002F1B711|nr:hypothetical protein [Nodosilinea nodulosa]
MALQKITNLTAFLDGQSGSLAQKLAAAGDARVGRVQRIEAKPYRQRTSQENAFLNSLQADYDGPTGSPAPAARASYPSQGSYATELYPSRLSVPGSDETVYRPEMPWGSLGSTAPDGSPVAGGFQKEFPGLYDRIVGANPGAATSAKYNMPYNLGVDSVTGARTNVDFTQGGLAGRAAADYLGGASGAPGLIDKMGGPQAIAGGYSPGVDVSQTLTDVYGNIASGRQYPVFPTSSPYAWTNPGTVQDVPNRFMYQGTDPDGNVFTGAGGSTLVDASEVPRLVGMDEGIHSAATRTLVPRTYSEAIDTRDRVSGWQPGKTSDDLDSRSYPAPTSGNPVLSLTGNAYDAAFTRGAETTPFLAARGQQAQAESLANMHLQRSIRDDALASNDAAARARIAASSQPVTTDLNLNTTYVVPEAREAEYGFISGSRQPNYSLTATDESNRVIPGLGFLDNGQRSGGSVRPAVRGPGQYGLNQNAYVATRSDIYSPFTSLEPKPAWMSIDAPSPDQPTRLPTPFSSENPRYFADDPTFPGDALYDAPALIRKKLAFEEGNVTRALDQYDAAGGDAAYEAISNLALQRQQQGLPVDYLQGQLDDLMSKKIQARVGQERVISLMNSQQALQGNIQRAFDEMGEMPDFLTTKTRQGSNVVTEDLPLEEVLRRNQQNPVRQVLSLPQSAPSARSVRVNGQDVPIEALQKQGYRLYGSPDSSSIITKHMDEDAGVLSAPPDSPAWRSTEPVFRALHQVDPTVKHNQVRTGVQYLTDSRGNVQIINPGTVVQGAGGGAMTAQPYDFVSVGSGSAPSRYRELRHTNAEDKLAAARAEIEQARAEGWNVNTSPDYAAVQVPLDELGQLNAQRRQRGLHALNLTEVNAMGGLPTARRQFNRQTGQLDSLSQAEADWLGQPSITLQEVRAQMARDMAASRQVAPASSAQAGQIQALASQVLQSPTVFRQAPVPREEIVGGVRGMGGQSLIANLNAQATNMAGVPTANIPVPRVVTPASGSALSPAQRQWAQDSNAQIVRNQAIADEVAQARRQVGSMIIPQGGPSGPVVQRTQAQPANPFPEATGNGVYSVSYLPPGVKQLPQDPRQRAIMLNQGTTLKSRELNHNPQFRSEHVGRLQGQLEGLRNAYRQAQAVGDNAALQEIARRGKKVNEEIQFYS